MIVYILAAAVIIALVYILYLQYTKRVRNTNNDLDEKNIVDDSINKKNLPTKKRVLLDESKNKKYSDRNITMLIKKKN